METIYRRLMKHAFMFYICCLLFGVFLLQSLKCRLSYNFDLKFTFKFLSVICSVEVDERTNRAHLDYNSMFVASKEMNNAFAPVALDIYLPLR